MLNFIVTKYFKQEADDELGVCLDERSPYGLAITGDIKILSMSRDQKVMTLLPSMEKCPMDFYQGVIFNAQI